MVAGRSKLLVWPTSDLGIMDEKDVEKVVDWVHEVVTAQYGVWVLMSFVTEHQTSRRRVVMVGPEGEMKPPEDNGELDVEEVRQWTMRLPA